jgi:uncharacterized protein (UPF0248 family)
MRFAHEHKIEKFYITPHDRQIPCHAILRIYRLLKQWSLRLGL